MSKKDYIKIAAIIKQRVDNHPSPAVEGIAIDLAAVFAEDNPNFDRNRFLAACGVTA